MAEEKGKKVKYEGAASYDDIIRRFEACGLVHVNTGKTRETFINPDFPDLLYILATDRISIFDIVLNARIHMKGAVLTAMTVYWLTNVFHDIPHHLVDYGANVGAYLPAKLVSSLSDKERFYIMKHMLVVKKTEVLKVEAIVRGFLTGSGLKDYKKSGMICGIELPTGLVDGSRLPDVEFTPSTKADYGEHDENISFDKAIEIIGEGAAIFVRDKSKDLYIRARDLAKDAGIIIADTKFELGVDKNGNIILIDEVLTPDSSRYWPEEQWLIAMAEGKTPPSLDKQLVRDAGAAAGVKDNHDWIPPIGLLKETSERYQQIFKRLVGKPLGQFWRENMGIMG
ncbi:phosphoribosylaminoimidazolesuccinocarboxamide synthase [Candidatus Parcubacteria bacterium]|nr:phosphoribosylaminoimidazolesuccinocarboxamide synthase [Patescibacteria group bacterium]MBU4309226.1 phosphoribosylaminoimidazolesuccinocarboxamide synthase [Patescibacteria group bacterium]MBU4577587.1 phosphoribosylaminoimidazolesuccinocarboxamide synthase [Patescibacteria group bacterium]MCG2697274.1 phosphoribosylaminoimidazolesuccinocarboxamide synthase [Candidatus Parcubacteria bacterium]